LWRGERTITNGGYLNIFPESLPIVGWEKIPASKETTLKKAGKNRLKKMRNRVFR